MPEGFSSADIVTQALCVPYSAIMAGVTGRGGERKAEQMGVEVGGGGEEGVGVRSRQSTIIFSRADPKIVYRRYKNTKFSLVHRRKEV